MRRPGARAPDLSEVHAFVAAARTGSLAKAATELQISTPAVAKRVRNLETAAGTVLLARSTRGVRLTPAGEAIYDAAGRLLESAAALFAPLGGEAVNGSAPPAGPAPDTVIRTRARELALIADMALEMADADDAPELLRRVVEQLQGALPAAAVAVFELEPAARRLHLAAASGPLATHAGSLALESAGPDATMLAAVFDAAEIRALGLGRPLTSVIDGAERPQGVLALYGPAAVDARDHAVVLDVTASVLGDALRRIALETALREHEAMLIAFFAAAADPMLIADDDRRFTDANAAAVEVLGYTREELLRMRIDDLLPTEEREHVDEAWRAFRELGTVRAPGVLRCADGSHRAGEIHSRADFTPGHHLTVWRMAPP